MTLPGNATPSRPPRQPPRWRKGTRAMRLRTARAAGNRPGQPEAVITDPLRIPAQGHPVRGHRCGECFGPRSAYRRGLFCSRCEREMFGSESDGYGKFIRSERARMRHVLRRWKAAGFHLNG